VLHLARFTAEQLSPTPLPLSHICLTQASIHVHCLVSLPIDISTPCLNYGTRRTRSLRIVSGLSHVHFHYQADHFSLPVHARYATPGGHEANELQADLIRYYRPQNNRNRAPRHFQVVSICTSYEIIASLTGKLFSEWVTHQHRDTYASIIGHPPLLSYIAVADGESLGRAKFEMCEVSSSAAIP
jgi:hypothetical protein